MKKLLTLLAFAFVAFTVDAQSTQKGDVNGDGEVSVNDVAMIVNYILGNENSNFIIANADINGDGEIDINDVMGTVSFILGDNTPQAYLTCPDDNHPHMIDLGLPSGTKWACCNVGADKPEDYGGYYAWGETEEKLYYDRTTYQYYYIDTNEEGSYGDLGDGYYWHFYTLGDISGTQYDVAHVKWGGAWQMPSKAQFQELMDECTDSDNNYGRIFTSKHNNAKILMPFTSFFDESGLVNDVSDQGLYWTSTELIEGEYNFIVYILNFIYHNGIAVDVWMYKMNGLAIRPVWVP